MSSENSRLKNSFICLKANAFGRVVERAQGLSWDTWILVLVFIIYQVYGPLTNHFFGFSYLSWKTRSMLASKGYCKCYTRWYKWKYSVTCTLSVWWENVVLIAFTPAQPLPPCFLCFLCPPVSCVNYHRGEIIWRQNKPNKTRNRKDFKFPKPRNQERLHSEASPLTVLGGCVVQSERSNDDRHLDGSGDLRAEDVHIVSLQGGRSKPCRVPLCVRLDSTTE